MNTVRIGFGSFAVLFLALFGWVFVKGKSSEEWPQVTGHLDSRYVAIFGAGLSAKAGDTNVRIPVVEYRYSVNGTEYIGTAITAWDVPFYREKDAAQQVFAKVPEPGMLKVFYDPKNPAVAVLMVGAPILALTELLFASMSCCLLCFALPRVSVWFYAGSRT